ncbi:MAG: hypothetical protein KAK00_02200, partial [Nanoarchaeota archaeon]|nr:hypothetical protein [Nanoarchaeota archaeon]
NIIKENKLDYDNVAVLGIYFDGVNMLKRMVPMYNDNYLEDGMSILHGSIDGSLQRDDMSKRIKNLGPIEFPTSTYDITGKHIILVDSVYQTGRTAMAAISELNEWGRPSEVYLTVLIRRQGREIPSKPHYAYRNIVLPADLEAKLVGFDDSQRVILRKRKLTNSLVSSS